MVLVDFVFVFVLVFVFVFVFVFVAVRRLGDDDWGGRACRSIRIASRAAARSASSAGAR